MVEHAEEHGAISDENHWAYPLIENFRRRAAKSKKSLTQIFRAEYRPGESACFISWSLLQRPKWIVIHYVKKFVKESQ